MLFINRNMDTPERHPFASGDAFIYTARCPGHEVPNEDAAALLPFGDRSGVIVLADGLGGNAGGFEAAHLAIRELKTAIKKANGPAATLLRTAILNGFENANEAVRAMAVGAATTLAVVEIQEDTIRPYHVGDSAILIIGNRGKIKLQTIAHSPIGYGVEAGLIDETEAMHHEDRHLVSNVIGSPEMHIVVGPSIHLAPRDTLLVMTDGLADNLHPEEIVDCLRKGPLEQGAQRLAKNATQRMANPAEGQPSKPDDLTFVAFRAAPASRTRNGNKDS